WVGGIPGPDGRIRRSYLMGWIGRSDHNRAATRPIRLRPPGNRMPLTETATSTILVVDDDPFCRNLLVALLDYNGYRTVAVVAGPAAPQSAAATAAAPGAPGEPPGLTREQTLSAIRNFANVKTLAGAAAQVISLAASPKTSVSELVGVLKQDPVLTARVLQLA